MANSRLHSAFHNRSIVLTGASSGIGHELALQLAEVGARLTLAARDVDRLEQVAAACREASARNSENRGSGADRVLVQRCDITSEDDCRDLMEVAVDRFGGLDVLMANAGQTLWGLFEEFKSLAPLRKVMDVNYFGSVHCTRWALPHLRESKGQIVVVSSLTGKTGVPTRSGYAASKHALHGFFDTLRIELRGSGVDITMACPDFVATETRERAWGVDDRPVGTSPVHEDDVMTAETCARLILEGAAKRKRELILSRRGKLGLLLKIFAPSLVDRIAARAIEQGR